MGRLTRNRELLSVYKSPDANTAVKRVLLDAMDNTAEYNNIKRLGQAYNQAVAPASATSRMAGTALDDFGIDISPDSKSKRSSDLDRVKLGDKDKALRCVLDYIATDADWDEIFKTIRCIRCGPDGGWVPTSGEE